MIGLLRQLWRVNQSVIIKKINFWEALSSFPFSWRNGTCIWFVVWKLNKITNFKIRLTNAAFHSRLENTFYERHILSNQRSIYCENEYFETFNGHRLSTLRGRWKVSHGLNGISVTHGQKLQNFLLYSWNCTQNVKTWMFNRVWKNSILMIKVSLKKSSKDIFGIDWGLEGYLVRRRKLSILKN